MPEKKRRQFDFGSMFKSGNRGWMRQPDVLVAIGVVTIVMMLIIPMPSFMLDFFMAVSITLGILILLVVIFVPRSFDFSVFPSLLLITTVFRLAINVSSTRLILLKGAAFDGKVVRTFGNFVVGGDYVVGLIVFIILVLVQFMVITKGSTRTAEVAARFTLDAMPVKMMGVDQEVANGSISEEEARVKKADVRREADFFGAMDGASKFVQGDVKVGIVITFVNIIGGFIIGMVQRGESFQVALKTYTLLSVGDGLVSQIPSLLLSTATGLIVTRSVSNETLGEEIKKQLGLEPKALFVSAGVLFTSALIPGFPKISTIGLGLLMATLGWLLKQNKEEAAEQEKKAEEKQQKSAQSSKPEDIEGLLTVDPLELELGINLIPLADPNQGGALLERVKNIRVQSAMQYGVIVPPIRIRDNINLQGGDYSILIQGVEIAHGSLEPNKLMAMNAGGVIEEIEGVKVTEPAFGLEALWVDTDMRDQAERKGYNVVDCPTVVTTHLGEIIKQHSAELLGRQEVKKLIDNVRQEHPAVVDELMNTKQVALGDIQKVLQNLLRERVSIRNLITILETMASYIDYVNKDMGFLTEYVRVALARQICRDYLDENSTLSVITIDPQIETVIKQSIHDDPIEGRIVGMDPQTSSVVMNTMVDAYNKCSEAGFMPVYLVSPNIRSVLFSLLEREIVSPVVLAYSEIPKEVNVNVVISAMINNERSRTA